MGYANTHGRESIDGSEQFFAFTAEGSLLIQMF